MKTESFRYHSMDYRPQKKAGYLMTISGFALLPVIVLANTIDTIDINTAARNIRLYD